MAARLQDAFELCARAAAALFDVDFDRVTAPSRGRGYKPPVEVVGARKAALWLTVSVTGCSYADLARVAGLHKDTVCSHCADVRDMSMDDEVEELTEALRSKLTRTAAQRTKRWRAQQLIRALEVVAAEPADAATHPTSSVISSDDEKKIVVFDARRRA